MKIGIKIKFGIFNYILRKHMDFSLFHVFKNYDYISF